MIDDLWYKNTVVYCLDVKTFMDSNGDGIGDLEGLSRRLDYLSGIGVGAVWLVPFYPSQARQRLRHHRQLRHRPAARDPRGLRRLHPR
ncbi:MAG: alpha-amylase family glycosyl hydrolase, partial [Myxococcaceae bacterium]